MFNQEKHDLPSPKAPNDEVRKELRRMIPERVLRRLSVPEKEAVVMIYKQKPGTVASICQKSLTANNPHAYFTAALWATIDRLAAEPKPVGQRKPHDAVDCPNCADTGFVLMHDGDAAPCFCPLGVTKQQAYGTVHYTTDDFDPVVAGDYRISLHEYAQSEAGRADPNLAAFRRMFKFPVLPEIEAGK